MNKTVIFGTLAALVFLPLGYMTLSSISGLFIPKWEFTYKTADSDSYEYRSGWNYSFKAECEWHRDLYKSRTEFTTYGCKMKA